MKRFALAVLFLGMFPFSAAAFDFAGLQPLAPYGVLSTFSAESLPRKGYSLELQMERSREPNFYRAMMKGAYGISESVEVMLSVPYVFHFESWKGREDGIEDVAIGLKHRFLNEGRYHPAIAYILTGSLPTGGDLLSTDGRIGAGIAFSKKIGPFDANINAFYLWPLQENLNEEILLMAGLRLHATHSTWILAEAVVRNHHNSGSYDQLEARLGYRIKSADRVYTTIGLGADFKNRHPEYRIIFSVNFTSPTAKKKLRQVYEEE